MGGRAASSLRSAKTSPYQGWRFRRAPRRRKPPLQASLKLLSHHQPLGTERDTPAKDDCVCVCAWVSNSPDGRIDEFTRALGAHRSSMNTLSDEHQSPPLTRLASVGLFTLTCRHSGLLPEHTAEAKRTTWMGKQNVARVLSLSRQI